MTLAFLFDSVGFGEWLVLLAVILIVVGPKRLPATARKFGQYYAKFRRAAESFKRQLLDMDSEFGQAVKEVDKAVSEVQKSIEHADAQWDALAAGYPPESVTNPSAAPSTAPAETAAPTAPETTPPQPAQETPATTNVTDASQQS